MEHHLTTIEYLDYLILLCGKTKEMCWQLQSLAGPIRASDCQFPEPISAVTFFRKTSLRTLPEAVFSNTSQSSIR
jgi:hypothetical protein